MSRPSRALAILLIVGGIVGLIAAFALTTDKFIALQNTIDGVSAKASCDISVLVQCSKNLNSPEGSVFGFPNPLIGLVAFPITVLMGVASLIGVRFPRWWWALFNVGMAFAIGFVAYLMSVSVFVLNTLCPWCMTVWAVVIPMSLATTLYNLREQNLPLGDRVARIADRVYGWMPILTLVVYVAFAVIAQMRLDVLHRLFV
ncbi:putative membrane protein [Amnibacterium kyonggiense]|uniref:Putative membrane protein n=1 Tax=Amnibacterium kyonggiense TaxID=595671 RepID=A0A4R7FMJ4_9MICO|nr:putative membrane protein [Amnibacterium kyonggiense]